VVLVEGSGMLNVWFVFTAATSLVGVGSNMNTLYRDHNSKEKKQDKIKS
jgi:hypothetical protein